jgi:hypothetical protein
MVCDLCLPTLPLPLPGPLSGPTMREEDACTGEIVVASGAVPLPAHAAVASAAAGKARRAHEAKILGGGVGKGPRSRRDAVTDRQHVALKRSAARFFGGVTKPQSG